MSLPFEMVMYRIQVFAAKLQQKNPQTFLGRLQLAFGGVLTQFVMGACFMRIMAIGESQWRKRQKSKRKSATIATRKSGKTKQNAPSVE
jgi:hypothetical protein